MTRGILLAAFAVALCFAGARAPRATADRTLHELSVWVVTPDGRAVSLQFVVDAPDPAQAADAAAAAIPALVPGGRSVETDGVNAQFAPWWWSWETSELPVPMRYNPSGAIDGVAPAAIAAALDPWGQVGGSRFAFAWAGITDAGASLPDGATDGLNVISWRYLDCSTACVLGVTTKMEAHESDVVLNSNPAAKLGAGAQGTVDTQTVMLHEAGHVAGLEHSCAFFDCTPAEQDAVMYFQYRGLKHELQPDDIDGIRSLYPGERPPPGVAVATLQLEIHPGWVLTMLPAGPVEDAVSSLTCVDAIYAWDGGDWDRWVRGMAASFQGVAALRPAQAYWVHAGASCSHLFILD